MLYGLNGIITTIENEKLVLNVNGVYYQLFYLQKDDFKINDQNFIYIKQIIKEDQHTLFGFKTKSDSDLFSLLLLVSGVGSKTARNIVACMSYAQVEDAVLSKNVLLFKTVPGIGQKVASQIILDLANKIKRKVEGNNHTTNSQEELDLALLNLGFSKKEIIKAKSDTNITGLDTKEALTSLLRSLKK